MIGTRSKNGAHFLVEGVNLGDGKPVRAWLRIMKRGVEVRRYRSHRAWIVSLAEAAGLIARAAQARAVMARA